MRRLRVGSRETCSRGTESLEVITRFLACGEWKLRAVSGEAARIIVKSYGLIAETRCYGRAVRVLVETIN